MNKRGQFYLIAAIILATIIIAIAVVSNYSSRQENIRIYDLRDELHIESVNVLDYGVYNELNESQLQDLLEEFVNNYINQSEESNLYFIFGNQNNITLVAYQDLAEAVSLGIGGDTILLDITEGEVFSGTYAPTGNRVEITIADSTYAFNLNKGENFYFVISQDFGDSGYVITG